MDPLSDSPKHSSHCKNHEQKRIEVLSHVTLFFVDSSFFSNSAHSIHPFLPVFQSDNHGVLILCQLVESGVGPDDSRMDRRLNDIRLK